MGLRGAVGAAGGVVGGIVGGRRLKCTLALAAAGAGLAAPCATPDATHARLAADGGAAATRARLAAGTKLAAPCISRGPVDTRARLAAGGGAGATRAGPCATICRACCKRASCCCCSGILQAGAHNQSEARSGVQADSTQLLCVSICKFVSPLTATQNMRWHQSFHTMAVAFLLQVPMHIISHTAMQFPLITALIEGAGPLQLQPAEWH